jgi:hypothetical protein
MWYLLIPELDGTPMIWEFFGHKTGYQLFLAIKAFADTLPENPA